MSSPTIGSADGPAASGSTGRYIVVFGDDIHGDETAMAAALQSAPGISSIASTSDFAGPLDVEQAAAADATMFARLGVAVVSEPGPFAAMSADTNDPRVQAIAREWFMFALTAPVEAAPLADTAALTWGLQAARVDTSPFSGKGITVAVLDTGFTLDHPDFVGRDIVSQSFVPNEPVQDGAGHGTHCVGTSCGPLAPAGSRRYGIAYDADILVGKVLSNAGSGQDSWILAGMDWALTSGAQVISMSLGANIRTVSPVYEAVGRRALAAGTLIVAAAGNNAVRPQGEPGFVGRPANSPSVLAVGALDATPDVAFFSAAGGLVPGGDIDVAAPGVAVHSSWPLPKRYNTISGTSMATPHVAGIAALWAEKTGARGKDLWTTLVDNALPLDIPAADIGTGLVQAPQ